MCGIIQAFLFFFSSRRRHTKLTCDWSSDVCSSDLRAVVVAAPESWVARARRILGRVAQGPSLTVVAGGRRSEERRVGKEWRSRWAREHEKENILTLYIRLCF